MCWQSNLSAPQATVHVHPHHLFEVKIPGEPCEAQATITQSTEVQPQLSSSCTSKTLLRLDNVITHQFIWLFVTNLVKFMGNWIVWCGAQCYHHYTKCIWRSIFLPFLYKFNSTMRFRHLRQNISKQLLHFPGNSSHRFLVGWLFPDWKSAGALLKRTTNSNWPLHLKSLNQPFPPQVTTKEIRSKTSQGKVCFKKGLEVLKHK